MIQRNSERLIQKGRRLEADHPNIIIHSFKGERPGIYCSQNSTQADCCFRAPHRLQASTPVWFTPRPTKIVWLWAPILSATQTYNYGLAKLIEEKLQPLSYNQYTITDTFEFAEKIGKLQINNGDILVSYDVSSLFYQSVPR